MHPNLAAKEDLFYQQFYSHSIKITKTYLINIVKVGLLMTQKTVIEKDSATK